MATVLRNENEVTHLKQLASVRFYYALHIYFNHLTLIYIAAENKKPKRENAFSGIAYLVMFTDNLCIHV